MRFFQSRFMVAPVMAGLLTVGLAGLVLQAQGPVFEPSLIIHTGTGGLGFGSVAVGVSSAPKAITLQNISNGPINVQAATIPLAPLTYNDFGIASSDCGTVAAGAYCTVALTFTPGANGPRSGRLQLQTSLEPPIVVPLVGQGVDPAFAQPSVGPIDGRTGFPLYFSDGAVALELCLDHTPPLDAAGNPVLQVPDPTVGLTPTMCLGPVPDPTRAPAVTDDPATTNFGAEAFWWSTEAEATPVAGSPETGLLIVMAQEAAFATEDPKAGDQWAFGRLRFRVDDAVPSARYRFTHPFGVDIHQAGDTRVFATSDIGCFATPCDFGLALPGSTRILNFLQCVSPPPPAGYLGDPNQSCRIAGSPFGTNFFKVERETTPGAWTLVGQTDLFAVSGKITTPVAEPPATNQAPNAVDDLASTPYNTPVIVAVLNNDTDTNAGDVLTITTVTNGVNGTAVVTGATITYTPSAAFTAGGIDTFQYAIRDSGGLTDTASVRVTVAPVPPPNRAPTAISDTFALVPDQLFPAFQLLVSAPGVLGNDTDPDGNPLTAELVASPADNPLAPGLPTVSMGPDGSLLFNNGVGIAQNTAVTFTYRVSDGELFSAPATVTINITRPTGQPVGVDDALTTARDTLIVADVDANDTNGGAPGGNLRQTATALTVRRVPAHGTVRTLNVPNPDGTANRHIEYTPGPGFVGVDTFTYTIADTLFTSNVATVTVTVTGPPANNPPVAANDSASTAFQTPVTIGVLANDTDADGNLLSVTGVSALVGGTAVVNGSETVTYTPAAGFSGAGSFSYAISDGSGGTASAGVIVAVAPPANQAPIAGDDALTATGPVTFTATALLANDLDADGNALTIATMATASANGTIAAAGAGSWTYTPRAGFEGVDSFNYTVTDGQLSDVGAVSVTVTIPVPAGLVLALGFNEAGGTIAADTSGGSRNGTIREAVFVAGRFGNALSFDGVNDWVTVADAAALDLTTGMTIEAWVKPTALSGWETIALKERGVGAMSYGLYAHDGAPLAGGAAAPAATIAVGGTDRSVRGLSPLPIGVWTHVASTYDGTTQRLYVNGALVASRAQTGSMTTSTSPLRIGGNNAWAGEFFGGLIDEVRVYNRALSVTEIQGDMNAAVR
jgi:hypothetical protein